MSKEIKITIMLIFLFVDIFILGPIMISHRSYELPIAFIVINIIITLIAYNKIKTK